MLSGLTEADFVCALYGLKGHVGGEARGHVVVERDSTQLADDPTVYRLVG